MQFFFFINLQSNLKSINLHLTREASLPCDGITAIRIYLLWTVKLDTIVVTVILPFVHWFWLACFYLYLVNCLLILTRIDWTRPCTCYAQPPHMVNYKRHAASIFLLIVLSIFVSEQNGHSSGYPTTCQVIFKFSCSPMNISNKLLYRHCLRWENKESSTDYM